MGGGVKQVILTTFRDTDEETEPFKMVFGSKILNLIKGDMPLNYLSHSFITVTHFYLDTIHNLISVSRL